MLQTQEKHKSWSTWNITGYVHQKYSFMANHKKYYYQNGVPIQFLLYWESIS